VHEPLRHLAQAVGAAFVPPRHELRRHHLVERPLRPPRRGLSWCPAASLIDGLGLIAWMDRVNLLLAP
jgi:hypothetical protein